jgi:hypothetical protein
MRRTSLVFSLAATLLFMVAAAPVTAAPGQTTGDLISLKASCATECGAPQTFAAGEPFYISHGHGISISGGDNPALGKYDFTLDVDGVPMAADYKLIDASGHGDFALFWVYNFPAGMTGVYEFTGHWYAPCGHGYFDCEGQAINTVVEMTTMSVTVTFE